MYCCCSLNSDILGDSTTRRSRSLYFTTVIIPGTYIVLITADCCTARYATEQESTITWCTILYGRAASVTMVTLVVLLIVQYEYFRITKQYLCTKYGRLRATFHARPVLSMPPTPPTPPQPLLPLPLLLPLLLLQLVHTGVIFQHLGGHHHKQQQTYALYAVRRVEIEGIQHGKGPPGHTRSYDVLVADQARASARQRSACACHARSCRREVVNADNQQATATMITCCPSVSSRSFAGLAQRTAGSSQIPITFHLHKIERSFTIVLKVKKGEKRSRCSPSAAPRIVSCQQSAAPRAQHLYGAWTQTGHLPHRKVHQMRTRGRASPHLHCVASSGWGTPRSLLSELWITTARDWRIL